MKILLVDDHYLIGKSLELLLSKQPEVTDFQHLIQPERIDEVMAAFQPTILLMDIHMGKYNGIELGERLLQQYSFKLVFLSGFDLIEYRDKAQSIGAHGFFSKNTPIDQLIQSLLLIDTKDTYLFPEKDEKERIHQSLSSREKEILQYLSQGTKQTAIASELHISDRTVRNHIYTINEKLGTTSALTSVVKGIELGIIQVKLQ